MYTSKAPNAKIASTMVDTLTRILRVVRRGSSKTPLLGLIKGADSPLVDPMVLVNQRRADRIQDSLFLDDVVELLSPLVELSPAIAD